MERSESEISPMEFASASNSAWRAVSSRVAVVALPSACFLPSFVSICWPTGEHTHVAEQHVADIILLTRAIPDLPDQDDVDAVVRQDEIAGRSLFLDLRRDGAHAGRQNGGEHTSLTWLDQLLPGYRLAGEKRCARDRTGQLVHGIRGAHARDVASRDCILGPRLPAQHSRAHDLTETNFGCGDEHLRRLGLDLDALLDRRLIDHAAHEDERHQARRKGDRQADDLRASHCARYPVEPEGLLLRIRPEFGGQTSTRS